MKFATLMAPSGLVAVVAAGQILPRAPAAPNGYCCFTLTADAPGLGSAIVEEDTIGQNRIYSSYPDGFYCVSPGEPGKLFDSIGNTCIISPSTQQFQCTLGLTSAVEFTISTEGHFQADGDNNFYACKRGGESDDGSYLIYSSGKYDTTDCMAITLETTGDACAGHGDSTAPVDVPTTLETVAYVPPATTSAYVPPPSDEYEPVFTIQTETSVASEYVPIPTDYVPPPAPAGGDYEVPPPDYEAPPPDYVVTVTAGSGYVPPVSPPGPIYPPPPYEGGVVTVTYTAPSDGGYAPPPPPPPPGYEVVTVTETAKPYVASPPPVYPPPVYVTVTYTEGPGTTEPPKPTLPPPVYAPGETPTVTVYVTASYDDTPVPLPSPIKPSSCPQDLSGDYRAPALIIPVSPEAPDAAYGTQFIAEVTSGNSTVFSYDIPESWAGSTCSVFFTFPVASWTAFPGAWKYEAGEADGKVQFSRLEGAIDNKVTYASKPKVAEISEVQNVEPGNNYEVFVGACAAGQRLAFEIMSVKGTEIEYFQATAPKPVGLWIARC